MDCVSVRLQYSVNKVVSYQHSVLICMDKAEKGHEHAWFLEVVSTVVGILPLAYDLQSLSEFI